ncbi:ferric reductase-like transmembrane domain-containing protein [Streptomonospora nanhaiensis]|uniref:DMSO/TMAO reductase YedYZ heme-binding membrane subunit n=1 Tax=Streptomonospora nanhaiensis TaxID=1323731 RepID=A0A853BP87_9ACTN|nr:ferric reductase-like transmembrane domain-containing protein [Streptomonospora nanhaiensis]MBV2365187.1 ferric reductase-like transmembrane domain-containing protein [Streptomonospora nanhaiensis]MBX9387398.1 ferric reductase-like transmembrane domain-containing protein [Streptomonospora nanhaiensis]NYI97459.1 DMSO/TMAO reductase YedYZ heme-binding membrane subunit [Streptomonospora nanhaiensis]
MTRDTTRPAAAGHRRGFDWAALRSDARGAIPDATAALAATAAIFAWLYARVADGGSPTVEVMPMLADPDRYWMYWLCQAFGWSALLWAWITVMLGLIRSTARARWNPVPPARLERWHRTTSLTTIGLMFGHAFMFFAELVRGNEHGLGWAGRIGTAFVETFVPGGYATGTGQVAILLGLIALYLAIPLGLAFYLRHRTGSRVWLALHRFVIVVYALSVWHTLLYGTNVWFDGWFRTAVWLLQLPVAALVLVRLLAPARRNERLHTRGRLARALGWTARIGTAAAILTILAVAITGRDGGRTRGVEGAEMNVTQGMVWIALFLLLLAITTTIALVARKKPKPT